MVRDPPDLVVVDTVEQQLFVLSGILQIHRCILQDILL